MECPLLQHYSHGKKSSMLIASIIKRIIKNDVQLILTNCKQ